jgi:hypothetical protein
LLPDFLPILLCEGCSFHGMILSSSSANVSKTKSRATSKIFQQLNSYTRFASSPAQNPAAYLAKTSPQKQESRPHRTASCSTYCEARTSRPSPVLPSSPHPLPWELAQSAYRSR